MRFNGKPPITLEQHREFAPRLQQSLDSVRFIREAAFDSLDRDSLARLVRAEKSIRDLRTDLQTHLLKAYPNAGGLYY